MYWGHLKKGANQGKYSCLKKTPENGPVSGTGLQIKSRSGVAVKAGKRTVLPGKEGDELTRREKEKGRGEVVAPVREALQAIRVQRVGEERGENEGNTCR